MKRQSGFTLVEIAIVLVVIGLLLGGVLKGQELVMNAKVRNTISEYNNVASASFAYQDRYRAIPGDDDTAGERWSELAGGADGDNRFGNGNGIIEGGNDYGQGEGTAENETGYFWLHLRNDRLITGDIDSAELPRASFDGYTGVRDGPLDIIGLGICQSNIPGKPAMIIDNRIDDGDGTKGTLQGAELSDGSLPGSAPENSYTDGTYYTLCREL